MSRGNWNTFWAEAFFDELARSGVRDICVAPGSRSTPLVLAAAREGRFRMVPILDERSAGFFALGVGKASGRPAVVITTSGTAAANLLPSVVEASQGEVPLLVLTADRPHHLRDTDGNQAMDQIRLFGTFPRAFFEVELPRLEGPSVRHLRGLAGRAVSTAVGPPRGPVHLNFPFDKPLEPGPVAVPSLEAFKAEHPRAGAGRSEDVPFVRVSKKVLGVSEGDAVRIRVALEGAKRGLVVAGPVPDPSEVGPAVLAFSSATGFPVLADPLSGARFSPAQGAQVVAGYDLFLRSARARNTLRPDLIVRVGGSPTSSGVLDYLAEAGDTRQIVIDEGNRWKDHLASAHDYVHASPAPVLERLAADAGTATGSEWNDLWFEAESRTRRVVEGKGPGELLEGEVLASIAESLPGGANLMVASSMPIRDLDAFGFPGTKILRVFGNRGASGIDGLVSTTLGIATASEAENGEEGKAPSTRAPKPTVGVLGDLAFLHDMNGLLALRSIHPRVIFVVVNNDGGGIFHTLPVRDHEPAFTRFFTTPHGLDFRGIAEFFGLPYSHAESLAEFDDAFSRALASGGPSVLEVRTRRAETHRRRGQVMAAVVEAMEDFDGP